MGDLLGLAGLAGSASACSSPSSISSEGRSGEPMQMAMEGRAPKALIRRLQSVRDVVKLPQL